jgi:hypothetical protein
MSTRRVAKKRGKEKNPDEQKKNKQRKPKPPKAKVLAKKAYQEPTSGPKHLRGSVVRSYRVMRDGIEIAKSSPDDPELQAVFSKGFNVSANKKNYGYPLEFKQETITFIDPKTVCVRFCKMLDTLDLKMQAAIVETRHDERTPFTCIRLFIHEAKINPIYKYVSKESITNPGYGDSIRTIDAILVLDFQKFKKDQNMLTITSINHGFDPPKIVSESYEVSEEYIKVEYANGSIAMDSSVIYSMYSALRDDIDDRLSRHAAEYFDGRVTDMYLPAIVRN